MTLPEMAHILRAAWDEMSRKRLERARKLLVASNNPIGARVWSATVPGFWERREQCFMVNDEKHSL